MGEETKNNLDLSIVIVNYKRHDLLDNCLASISKYSEGFTYEIIVVDNESTDDEIGIVCSKYDRTVLIRNKKNVGFAAANNQGLEVAKGKYILLLNNDTVFIENTLFDLIKYFQNSKEASKIIVSCRLLNKDGSLQESIFDLPTVLNIFSSNFFLYMLFRKSKSMNKYHYQYDKISSPIVVGAAIGAFLFAERNLIKEFKGFDERFYFYAEEMDLCKRLSDRSGKIIYFPSTSIIHLGGATTDDFPWFKYRNQTIAYLQYYQKHFYRFEFFLVIFFHYCGLLLRIPLNIIIGSITINKQYLRRGFYNFRQLFIYPKNQFKKT
ncbi:MAG: glycosyltransferase family 2 protein [Ignavibacteria bacterium]|nr:glycosyltransferase family 2 protein [Ignavibacteria bacterium]